MSQNDEPILSSSFADGVDAALADLRTKGLACIPNALTDAGLLRLRGEVDQAIDENGHRYFSIIDPATKRAGSFRDVVTSPDVLAAMRRIATGLSGGPELAARSEIYNVLRVIAGKDSPKTAFEFHYDATVVTAVVPIFIPDGAPHASGDLVAIPNLRPMRGSSIVNVLEKTFMQNPIAWKIESKIFGKKSKYFLKLVPGSIYLFNGYRTFHANLPSDAGAKRATLLMHFGDPHANSFLNRTVLGIRKWRETRRLRQGAHA